MAIDKRKFNEKSFVQQVPLDLFREFLRPWRKELKGLDIDHLDADNLHGWLIRADDSYPPDLMETLHRMNDIRSHSCVDRIMALADDAGLVEEFQDDGVAVPMSELVMRAYLRARESVFERVWNEEYLSTIHFSYDRVACEEKPLRVTPKKLEAFRKAACALVTRSQRGTFCNVTHYEDVDGGYFIVRHGWWPERHSIVKGGEEAVITFQPLKQDVIHYDAATGMIQMKTASRKAEDQEALCDAFAKHMLGDENLFRHDDATNLYTLEPLQRDGTTFCFGAGLVGSDTAAVIEIKVSRGDGPKRVVNTVKADNVLSELARGYDKIDLTKDEILMAKVRLRLERNGRVYRNTVTIKPPCICHSSSSQLPDTFRDLLDGNGFVVHRESKAVAG